MFYLIRDEDPSGVSGTGVVAEGCLFTNGKIAISWLGDWGSTVVWDNENHTALEKIAHIHGHGGLTRIVWIDHDVDPSKLIPDRAMRMSNAPDQPRSTATKGWGVDKVAGESEPIGRNAGPSRSAQTHHYGGPVQSGVDHSKVGTS